MKNLFIVVCLIAYNVSFAQTIATVDSILNTVDVEDTTHIHKTVESLNLAKQFEYDKGEARAYHYLGFIYSTKGSFPLSMEKYYHASELYKRIGDDEKRATVLINQAYLFHRMKDYEKELKYAKEAIKLSKEDSLKAYAYNSIGKALMGKGLFEQAIKNFNKAIQMKQKSDGSKEVYKFYTSLGIAFLRASKYDSAIETLSKIKQLSSRKSVLARMYNNIGTAYHLKKDYGNAKLNYLESIALDVISESGSACMNYAELLHENGEPSKAKAYLARGLKLDYDLGHLGRTLFKLEMYKESSLVRDSLYMHATKDFEMLRNTSVSIAEIESDLRNAREKTLLREKVIAERESKLWIICLSVLIIGMSLKYVWSYAKKIKLSEDVSTNIQRILKSE